MHERNEKEMLKYIVFVTRKEIGGLRELERECSRKGVKLCYHLPEETTFISETLYITDCEEICNQLLLEKANVFAWLHEDNTQENLGMARYGMERIEELDLQYAERIFQRYQKLPWKIAETKRCIIREMTEEDLDSIYQVYDSPSITRYMEGLYEDREKELEYTRSYIKNAYTFWGYGTWVIVRKEDGKLIGRVGFNLRDGYEEPELGFVIMESEQQKGYACECCKEILKVGKEEYEFQRVQALVMAGNRASVNLCRKLGFTCVEKVQSEEKEYLRFLLNL